ncbi:MAG: amino acid ABC transporter permease [Chloroflexi bacterium]|nr:amino acid ABC transporter permease [Chloroflexota bacterium]
MEGLTAGCEALVSKGWGPFCNPAIWGFIFSGWLITVQVALSSIALSLVFGLALALLRQSRFWFISWPTAAVVETLRALPVFLLILYTFLAGPKIGLQFTAIVAATVALTMYTSAVLSEIVRAGIGSLGAGQMEAARALGLSYPQAMRYVILPQALRNMTPAIVSQLITLTKDTSLAGTASLGLNEMTHRAGIIYNNYFNPLETLFVVACVYWVMCFSLSQLSRRLERGRIGPPVRVIGEADQVRVGGLR